MSEKWIQLSNRLIAKTKRGELQWQELSDSDTFQVVVGKNAIEIEQTGFGDDFEIRVRDGSGKVVDKFDDIIISRMTNSNYATAFEEMFSLIRRQISGTEQLLDDLLEELGKDEEIPF